MEETHKQFKMGSLFSGSGGFELAATLCDIEPRWSSEIEPFPIRVTTKRFPHMKHYGDISTIKGSELEPVDLITGGSPCQSLSVAGKRDGMSKKCPKCGYKTIATTQSDICPECGSELQYTRSGLFMEQIRVVKEMREKDAASGRTDEYIRPRFMLWENVTGAFSSNKGEDFRAVLEETARVKEETATIPRPPKGKWHNAGCIMGNGWSIAWRTLDAQYWGVPQRRRRIALVADFGGQCAGEILFKREGLSRNFTESRYSWQAITRNSTDSIGETGECELDSENIPITMQVRCGKEGGGKGALLQKDLSATLSTSNMQTLFQPVYTVDEKIGNTYSWEEQANTLAARDYKQPQAVVIPKKAYGICSYESNSMKSDNPNSGIYEADTSRTLDLNGGNPACNQGGIAICEPKNICVIEGNDSRPSHLGDGYKESETMYTLNATEQHAVAYQNVVGSLNASDYKWPQNQQVDENKFIVEVKSYNIYSDKAGTLTAKMAKGTGGPSGDECQNLVTDTKEYIVRRLTPLECSRLQGFPDWWLDGLETEDPTEQDIAFWREVFETHRKVVTGAKKPKTDKQIIKWLKNPYSDGAAYKLWGNGIALPCFLYVMEGIKEILERTSTETHETQPQGM